MPKSPRHIKAAIGLVLLTVAACQTPKSGSTSPAVAAASHEVAMPHAMESGQVDTHQAENHTLPPSPDESHGAHGPAPADGSSPNRDLHGPSDTAAYVAILLSEDRVRELKPDLVSQHIFDHAGLTSSSVVADIGCGPGLFVWPLAKLVTDGSVYAVDVEPAQLDALRAGMIERNINNAVPVLASYSTPHLPPQSCDAIFIADTYHHFEERVAYMRLLRSLLKPGGYLVLLEFKDGDLPIGPPAEHKVLRVDRHEELREAGFELDRELSTHIFHDFEFWHVQRAGS